MSDMETRIRERIAELTRQREQVVAAANQQIAALSGAIKELEALVKVESETDEQKQEEGGSDG